jgi:hypothetical protein
MQPTPTAKTLADRFFRLRIEQDGEVYQKGYFDEINSQLISRQLALENNDDDDLALVTPEDPTVLLTIVIQSLLALLQYDVSNGSMATLKGIKPGDSVGLIQERVMYPGVFEGMETLYGKEYYCVKRTDLSNGMVEKIPPGREWRIQPYSSTETFQRKRKSNVYGKALEQILDLPAGGLKAFQKSKMLVVAPDKNRLIDAIRNVKVGGDPLEAVFPIADYKSVDDWNYIGSFGMNNLKQEPLIGLVANVDMAVDIALRDPSYLLLVVDGVAKLRSHFGDIERLNNETSPRKVLTVLRATDEDELKALNGMGISSWVWKRDDFKQIELGDKEQQGQFGQHNQIMSSLAGGSPVFRTVSLPHDIDRATNTAYELLYSISRKVNPLPEAGILIRWGIGTLNSWLQLPVTITEHDEYIKRSDFSDEKKLSNKFETFKNRVRESYGLLIPATQTSDCESLIKAMQTVYDYLSSSSPKQDVLKEIIDNFSDESLDVFCCQPLYTGVVNEINGNRKINAKNIEQLSNSPTEQAVLTGWSNRKNAARAFLAPARNITYLLYNKELQAVQQVYRTHPCSSNSGFDNATRTALGLSPDTDSKVVEQTPQENQEDSIEAILSYVAERFGSSTTTYDLEKNLNDGDEIKQAHKVTLEDGSVVYADSDYLFDKVDRSGKQIKRVSVENIAEGDELVFANSERSMFEELLAILQKSDEYKRVYATASLWKIALQRFVEDTNSTDAELMQMFRMVGCPRNVQTIRSWLNGNVIGPVKDNYAAVRAIARITRNVELSENIEEVIGACKIVHALHVKTGWLLVRNIVNSTIDNGDDDVNEETKERLKTYSASAKLGIVSSISDNTVSVPAAEIGKLKEGLV